MVVLRTAISFLGSLDKRLHDILNPEENLRKAKDLIAKIPTIVAYYHRIREGKLFVHPDEQLSHAENFLWMLWGEEPDALSAKVMDLDLILHAEHTVNASTFSARIAASTLADIYAGVVSATGVLFGSLHGGASQEVSKMMREIKEVGIVQDWVHAKLNDRERIMGFGHRVYKCPDPRAEELKKLAEELEEKTGNEFVALWDSVVHCVQQQKPNLYPNVDYYAAAVYENLGIPPDLFINLFAMSRVVGWVAHIMEQYEDNKLIRPRQGYIGKRNRMYPKP
jgi:citrate synthase